MSEAASWQTSNSQYLAMALAWLRGKLERRAEQRQEPLVIAPPEAQPGPAAPAPEPASVPAPLQAESASVWRRLRRKPAVTSVAPALPPPAPQPAKGLLSSAAPSEPARSVETQAPSELANGETPGQVPPALTILARRLGLAPFERDVLLLCAAMELDTSIGSLCARAQADPDRPYPTFALALMLFDAPAWDALSPERPLRYWRLIEIHQPGGHALTSSRLRADERIVSYLKGLNYLDDRLAALLNLIDLPAAAEALPPSQQSAADSICSQLKQSKPGAQLPVIQLLGSDPGSKQLVAAKATATLGLQLYALPAAMLPAQMPELETLIRLWQRESMLLPLALYLEGIAAEGGETPAGGVSASVNRVLSRTGGVLFVDTRDVLPDLKESSLPVDVAKPTPAEQEAIWTALLGEAAGSIPASLAAQFNLSASSIRQIANRVAPTPSAADPTLRDHLWSACLASTRPRLDTLAQRVEAKATWDDIVLPQTEMDLLRQIAAQVGQRGKVYGTWGFAQKRNRGLGISALFGGDSGTGKTMAAEVIANDLQLNLYRIDLSAVVSKYIGETEKNLRRLFDAAEDGGAILFFDEADALFGKRSEVKDSHDRYANIEVNYLLQRMEAYGGLAILATNRQNALDPAFMRRLRFVVNFPHPGAADRKMIWQKSFPAPTPTEALDLDRLARLNLTGGNISSIALNAAFQAAQAGTSVTMPLIVEAARAELRKLGRVINELEFRRVGKAGPTERTGKVA
jgi:ATPase family associated with various cellular activities (AAA)